MGWAWGGDQHQTIALAQQLLGAGRISEADFRDVLVRVGLVREDAKTEPDTGWRIGDQVQDREDAELGTVQDVDRMHGLFIYWPSLDESFWHGWNDIDKLDYVESTQ